LVDLYSFGAALIDTNGKVKLAAAAAVNERQASAQMYDNPTRSFRHE
jgi:hypothetical protein